MRVMEPYAFICELGSVDTLGLRPIVVDDNFTSLHHEAWDNPLEHSVLIV